MDVGPRVAATPPECRCLDVSFFDNIAICVLHPDANAVVQASTQLIGVLAHACRKRGLRVNFKPDKTEILLSLRGPGSRQLKQQIHLQQHSTLPIVLEHGVEAVRVVHSYKHLGSYVQSDATSARDTRYQIAHARKAWGPLIRPLWTSKWVSSRNNDMIFAVWFRQDCCTRYTPGHGFQRARRTAKYLS